MPVFEILLGSEQLPIFSIFTWKNSVFFPKCPCHRLASGEAAAKCCLSDIIFSALQVFHCIFQTDILQIVLICNSRILLKHPRQVRW